MKERFYYNPIVTKSPSGIYTIQLYSDKNGVPKYMGKFMDHSYINLMERVHNWIKELKSITDNRSGIEKLIDKFKK